MPSRQRLSAPIRLASLPVTIHLLPEWCNHSSKALARSSLERSSSVHASAMLIDCCCRVLNKPSQCVMILRHFATQTSFQLILEGPNLRLHLLHSSFSQAVPKRLANISWTSSRGPSAIVAKIASLTCPTMAAPPSDLTRSIYVSFMKCLTR